MAADLATLGDDDVCSPVDGAAGLFDIHDLLHPQTANLVCLINKITWIAHVVGDHSRLGLQSRLECLRTEWPRLVIDREGSVGELAKQGPLHLELLHRTNRGAEAPQRTRRTNSRRNLD